MTDFTCVDAAADLGALPRRRGDQHDTRRQRRERHMLVQHPAQQRLLRRPIGVRILCCLCLCGFPLRLRSVRGVRGCVARVHRRAGCQAICYCGCSAVFAWRAPAAKLRRHAAAAAAAAPCRWLPMRDGRAVLRKSESRLQFVIYSSTRCALVKGDYGPQDTAVAAAPCARRHCSAW